MRKRYYNQLRQAFTTRLPRYFEGRAGWRFTNWRT